MLFLFSGFFSLFVFSFSLKVWAQTTGGPPAASGGLAGLVVPFLLVFVIFYFLILRPQQKQQKQRRKMLEDLKRGDEIVTSGGIYGKVVEFRDTVVLLQIANNMTVRIDRNHIQTVVSPPPEVKPEAKKGT